MRGLIKLRMTMIKMIQSDIIEELIQVETDEIVLNESASQPEKSNQRE